MRKKLRLGLLFSCGMAGLLSLTFSQTPEIQKILEKNNPGVLALIFYGENKVEIARGSAFAISEDTVVTNYHLTSQASVVEGLNFKGKAVKVEGLVAVDKNFDLALLKVKTKLQPLLLGNSDEISPGKRIFAIGANESQQIIISEGAVRETFDLGFKQKLVECSLSIPDTFGGGAIVDENSQVLGIVTVLEKLKFVVPVNSLKAIPKKAKAIDFKSSTKENYQGTFEGAFLAGRLYSRQDDTANAQKYLQKVLEFNPSLIEAQALLASVYERQRDFSSAIAAYQKVIALDPKSADAHFRLGLVYQRTQRFAEAATSLEKAVELNIDNRDVFFFLAQVYEELKDFEKASSAYEKYLSLKPANPWMGYMRLGLSRMELQQYDRAISAFQEALIEQPQDIKLNYSLAQAYQKAGMLEQAEEAFKKLIQLNPEDAKSYYGIILKMYDDAGKFEKAIDSAKKIIELEPKSEMAVYNLGIMYLKLKRYEEAIDSFKKALEIKPDFDYAYFQLGTAYQNLKNNKEAVEAFKKFVQLQPDSGYGHFFLGVNYMYLKDFDSALEPLKKSVELMPDYGEAWYNLAIAYLNLKDNYSARDAYKKLLTINPDLAQKLKKFLK